MDLDVASYQDLKQNFSLFQHEFMVLDHTIFQSMSRWSTERNTTKDEEFYGEREAALAIGSKTCRLEWLLLKKPEI